MVMPLRAGEAQPGRAQPLPPRLHILHVYTRLKMSSSKVSMVVRNISESLIFLKKEVQVARVVRVARVLCHPSHPWSCPRSWKLFLEWRTNGNPYLWWSDRRNF